VSTKSSIRCAFDDVSHEGFHLYTEAHDDENIYLEMEVCLAKTPSYRYFAKS